MVINQLKLSGQSGDMLGDINKTMLPDRAQLVEGDLILIICF